MLVAREPQEEDETLDSVSEDLDLDWLLQINQVEVLLLDYLPNKLPQSLVGQIGQEFKFAA